MKRARVTSSSVASVGYQPRTMTLEVEYGTGSVYRYFDVPADVHRELMAARSIGAYVNRNIKGKYPYRRLAKLRLVTTNSL